MKYEYKTSGVCSRNITLEIEDGIIKSVSFLGGCNGNLQGISALVVGQRPEDVIDRIRGIKCGFKDTSCPDQLARALEKAIEK
jgi:uncharacterized protein (TIGR03905 family)